MGRLEALIVAALGRSPYDDEVIETSNSSQQGNGVFSTAQQYDERGRPVNLDTRQRIRDQIRASNEVLHAAGIIEEAEEVKARDRRVQAIFHDEQMMGRRRLIIGPMVLVAGIWGVCGMRRRILLYRSYSTTGLLDILQEERSLYSVPHMLFTGFPSFIIYQAIEWATLVCHEVFKVASTDESKRKSEPGSPWTIVRSLSSNFLNVIPVYIQLHYRMFAMLQQLNLVSFDRWLPSFNFLSPFSLASLIRLRPFPTNPDVPLLLSWLRSVSIAAAPLCLMLCHAKIYSLVSSTIYKRILEQLPRPVNPDVKDILAEFYNDPAAVARLLSQNRALQNADPGLDDDVEVNDGWDSMTIPTVDNAPTQHAATLQALEGRSLADITAIPIDDSSDEEDQIMADGAYISLDMDPRVPDGSHGTWSAELQRVGPRIRMPIYHITTLTTLPVNLAAEGISAALSGILLSPLEAQMIRAIGRAFRRGMGAGTADMFRIGVEPTVGSWQGAFNLLSVHATEFVLTGVLWTMFTIGSQWLGGGDERWRALEEETDKT